MSTFLRLSKLSTRLSTRLPLTLTAPLRSSPVFLSCRLISTSKFLRKDNDSKDDKDKKDALKEKDAKDAKDSKDVKDVKEASEIVEEKEATPEEQFDAEIDEISDILAGTTTSTTPSKPGKSRRREKKETGLATIPPTEINKVEVPAEYPQLLSIPMTKRPLFPGFFKTLYVSPPMLLVI